MEARFFCRLFFLGIICLFVMPRSQAKEFFAYEYQALFELVNQFEEIDCQNISDNELIKIFGILKGTNILFESYKDTYLKFYKNPKDKRFRKKMDSFRVLFMLMYELVSELLQSYKDGKINTETSSEIVGLLNESRSFTSKDKTVEMDGIVAFLKILPNIAVGVGILAVVGSVGYVGYKICGPMIQKFSGEKSISSKESSEIIVEFVGIVKEINGDVEKLKETVFGDSKDTKKRAKRIKIVEKQYRYKILSDFSKTVKSKLNIAKILKFLICGSCRR